MSRIEAMPCTTVQKITGAIIMRMSAMKPSPSGFILAARPGQKCPSTTPIAIAIRTWI
jgi:hypothetical protein